MKLSSVEINRKYKEEKKLKKFKEKKSKDFKKAISRSRKPNKKKSKPKLNIRTILKKYHSWEKLYKYEEDYIIKKLISKADMVFGAFIRKRDIRKWCVSYGAEWCQNKVEQCCHWIGRAWYSHRWDEDNCFWWCVSCNCYHQEEHKLYFTKKQIEIHWIERVREQLKNRDKKKPSIDKLLSVIKKYEQ